jgi:peptide deformylase
VENVLVKIVRYPHPALRYSATAVKLIDNEVRKVIDTLRELMYQNEGLGLAAPQIAVPLQIFIMNPDGESRDPAQERVIINPIISEREGSEEREEGCLSFPDLYQKVRRPKKVRLQGFDAEGNTLDLRLEDLPARVVQHETDHLHAKLFIDYFNLISKLASKEAIASFENEFKRAQDRGEYPAKKEILRQLRTLEEQFAQTKPAEAVVM